MSVIGPFFLNNIGEVNDSMGNPVFSFSVKVPKEDMEKIVGSLNENWEG